MARGHSPLAVGSTLFLCGFFPLGALETPPPPYYIGKTEKVEVRLVTVDVLVLDGRDRTVPDQKAEDFELTVDGGSVPVDTLDATCSEGAAEDPRGLRVGAHSEPPIDSEVPRRIVFALDYLHLPYLPCPDIGPGPCLTHTRALEVLRRFIRDRTQGNEEIMVAVLDGGLRVEQTFTRDRAQVLQTLERIEYDITLWNGHFEHITERPFFGGLEALLEILDAVPGTKAVVLFSGGTGPGLTYDSYFRTLSALASNVRAAIYPVDCMGLFAKRFT